MRLQALRLGGLGLVLLFLAGLTFCARAENIPSFPHPDSMYGVGRTSFDWIDSSRQETASKNPDQHRELMVYVWYPTSRVGSAAPRAPYLPGAAAIDAKEGSKTHPFWSDLWPLLVRNQIATHSFENVHAEAGRYPVIIFSSGIGMTSFVYTTQIESLVSHGFIVAAIERTYDIDAVAFTDGRVVLASDAANRHPEPGKGESEAAFDRRMHTWEEAADNYWAGDISFVLDKLTAITHDGHSNAPFKTSMDLSRIGALGHSIGGRIVARACQLDNRIKACANEDGRLDEGAILAYKRATLPPQPFLFLQHTLPSDDELRQHGYTRERFEREIQGPLIEQLRRCPGGSFRVVIKSPRIDHMSFTDKPLLVSKPGSRSAAEARDGLKIINAYSGAFFQETLKGKASILDSSGNGESALVQHFSPSSENIH